MLMNTMTMGPADDSQLMNYLVRMIVPMRREFGRSLDVTQFLHDFAYAKEVINQALGSQDQRLRDYAQYVAQRYHGPRVADSPPQPVAAAAPAAAAQAPVADAAAEEAELRARMLKKYTDGLR
jgi:hypothetical protein